MFSVICLSKRNNFWKGKTESSNPWS